MTCCMCSFTGQVCSGTGQMCDEIGQMYDETGRIFYMNPGTCGSQRTSQGQKTLSTSPMNRRIQTTQGTVDSMEALAKRQLTTPNHLRSRPKVWATGTNRGQKIMKIEMPAITRSANRMTRTVRELPPPRFTSPFAMGSAMPGVLVAQPYRCTPGLISKRLLCSGQVLFLKSSTVTLLSGGALTTLCRLM